MMNAAKVDIKVKQAKKFNNEQPAAKNTNALATESWATLFYCINSFSTTALSCVPVEFE